MLLLVMKPVWKISSCQLVLPVQSVKLNSGLPSFFNCSLYNVLKPSASTMAILSVMALKPNDPLIFTRVWPSLAFFVVIMMTPLAPRTPKMASEDGSFRISMDSISCGFRKLMLSLNRPSTTYRGL